MEEKFAALKIRLADTIIFLQDLAIMMIFYSSVCLTRRPGNRDFEQLRIRAEVKVAVF